MFNLKRLSLKGMICLSLLGVYQMNTHAISPSTESPIVLVTTNSGETIIKDWTMLAESPTMIDVTYRIVRCSEGAVAEVQLSIFNENVMDQQAQFTVTVKDVDSGESTTHSVDMPVALASIVTAECGSSDNPGLSMTVPASYNAENLEVSVQF